MSVGTESGSEQRSFNGAAKAGNEIELSFRESGVIQQKNVKKGQKVKKGELIATLDNLEANLNFERAVTEVNSTESAKNTQRLSSTASSCFTKRKHPSERLSKRKK